MNTIDIAALLNLLGFTSGAVLYAMLLTLVMRHAPHAFNRAATAIPTVNRLLFATSLLGLMWNVGSLITAALGNFGINRQLSVLSVASFSALGFLPAVVVHSTLQTRDGRIGVAARLLKLAAYGLSTIAGCLHFYVSFTVGASFSDLALRTLTIGYLVLVLMLLLTKRQTGHKMRAIWASALAVFAVSALHLSHHHNSTAAESWLVELIGHHASLPLALAILYQDYRFAFADLFLKRALALLLLVALAFALYVNIAAPLLSIRGASGQLDPRAVVTLLCLWVGTSLLYPLLRRASLWFVDAVVLRRANYADLRYQLSQQIADRESVEEVLGTVCALLKPALTASHVRWMSADKYVQANSVDVQGTERFSAEQTNASSNQPVVLLEKTTEDSATVFVSTAEPPYFVIVLGRLAGGRRLLSDDVLLLEAAGIAAARRIDVLRVVHERCEQGLREQEISKLATEAQLRALRAQLIRTFFLTL
ncbi:MAG: hypothetical protein WKF84_27225 [Pyrinomonadaceae bacterium]